MISTPKNHIISYFNKRLNRIILKYKTVFANLGVSPNEGM